MEGAVPVDPSQAWENARKALEKVQTNNGKTVTGSEQQAAPGYGAGFGYGFWPGQQQPQQGCMYPGYMGWVARGLPSVALEQLEERGKRERSFLHWTAL
ncbi:hypothetical protein HPB50_002672 [Hyalomma asiaticum]|uniref:Uncharacterized protein n=1 Tax=Hyalomma asiaticum TaxID=266040 RepID=A0ACB7T502_HYAAI|nr:hypothetical protein HPB50_002672 [Hyalomma asiaticum]